MDKLIFPTSLIRDQESGREGEALFDTKPGSFPSVYMSKALCGAPERFSLLA